MSHKINVSVSKMPSKGSTLVVYTRKSPKGGIHTPKLSKEITKLLLVSNEKDGFQGNKKETLFFRSCQKEGFDHLLFVGLGDQNMDGDALKIAAATTIGKLKAEKLSEATVMGPSLTQGQKDAAGSLQAFAEGLFLSVYEYSELKSKTQNKKGKKEDESLQIELAFSETPKATFKKAIETASILAECQNLARRLGDSPGNHMTPTLLANEAVKAAKGTKMKVTVWDKARIKKERLGGLLCVSQGSSQDPRFIIMEYKGAGASKKPICFVGKGLTFDCGGISIKPSQGMEEMKYDMCGGAAVIGAMTAIAKLGLKVNAIGIVPSTENLAGPAAVKPGDVYIARNGKSVEVFNTDAEGRLILSDSLVYASEQKPQAIFDVATLTGAILVALGNHYTGIFTRDSKLMGKIQSAADQACEKVWQLPLDDFHVEDMKGTHADICNISGNRLAGSSTAAAFLEQFVEEGIPWAHFDIAGTAWNVNNRFPYHPKKGASGIMVRTFVELAQQF